MGWGSVARKPATAPQPTKKIERVGSLDLRRSSRPFQVEVEVSEPGDQEVVVLADEPVKKGHADEMAWMKFRSAFALETANMIVLDFVRDKGLFGELVKFARKRKR